MLTGGPGAGKTATLEMIKDAFCDHVKVVPEAASVVFGPDPHRVVVPNATEFVVKDAQVLELIRAVLPECCQRHLKA